MSSTLDPHAKIIEPAALLEMLGRPRDHRLVFTNGVFDILHRGHVEYLHAARTLGDALVVALNTDESVKRLGKGEDRPVNNEHDRAFVIAGLGCVDYVTFFNEDTPARIIASLLPDVLVKGGDYKPEAIVGREAVENAGGRVVVIPFVHGHSTTEMMKRIRRIP